MQCIWGPTVKHKSCLWQHSVPFFCTNGKLKAYSVARAEKLSAAIFVMKLKQHGSNYLSSPYLVNFEIFFCAL